MINGLIFYTHAKNLGLIVLMNSLIMIQKNDIKGSGCNKVILMPNSFVVSMEYAKLFLISKLHYS